MKNMDQLTNEKKREFYGNAHFKHPSPATLEELGTKYFPNLLDVSYSPVLLPDNYGETIGDLHERLAYVIHRVVSDLDAQYNPPKALLICTHAACMIALGRILTGNMPENIDKDDFQCYTASLSTYRRRERVKDAEVVGKWDKLLPRHIPKVEWRGKGILGGWDCEKNADCSYLSGGPERGWKFFGDESFLFNPNAVNDERVLEKVIGKKGSLL
jgi:transcription factor C subunit 7